MIDKETLLKGLTPERVVDLPGVGDVRVRGLSRSEAVSLAAVKDDTAALEQLIIRLGLVDPALSADEVAEWYAAAPAGLTDLIINAVEDLSGLRQGAGKSGVPDVREGSGP